MRDSSATYPPRSQPGAGSHSPTRASPASHRTVVQLSLRALLLIALPAAVLCALAAPWVRTLDASQQARLALLLSCMLAGAALILVVLCYKRRRAEQAAGLRLLKVRFHRRKYYHLLFGLWFVLWLASWLFALPDVLGRQGSEFWLSVVEASICISIGVGYLVVVVWWGLDPTTIEARERGLILGGRRVVSWGDIQSHRWGGPTPSHLTLQLHRSVINLRVAPHDKQQLDYVLCQKIASA